MNIFEQGLSRYLNTEQIKKIQKHKIGIGGAGGLGSNIAMMLVRSGFKKFDILDSDIIEPSNLNRQQFFVNEIGNIKVNTLKERLFDINPDLKISTSFVRWYEEKSPYFFKDCTFIIEAFDHAEDKQKFVEYYQDKTKYVICASGMGGFNMEDQLKIQKVGNIYVVGDQKNNITNEVPPMAPRVTACASLMAGLVLELALKN